MEKRIIYFSFEKSFWMLVLGIAIAFLGFIIQGVWFFICFIVACSFIFFALKSFSRKPQLIFSEEGLFVGFKMNKLIGWKSIDRIIIKEEEVDLRLMKFIEITSRIKTNAPSNKLVRRFPVGNLKISIIELQKLIDDYLSQKNKTDN
jgi:hypothetical protein